MKNNGVKIAVSVVLIGAGLVVFWAFGAGFWAKSSEVRAVVQAVESGHFAQAKEPLDRWLAASPDSAEAHYYKGRVALALGDVAGAVASLNRANALGLFQPERDLLRGLIASKLSRHAEAEPLLRRAYVESKRPDPQLSESLARTYLQAFDLTRSGAVIERWIREAPDDPRPYLVRAEIHLRSSGNEPDTLLNDYREALKRDSTLTKARLGLADELRKAHRNTEAAEEYETYLALEPNSATGHYGAGRNLIEIGDEAAATRHFERAMELDPKNPEVLKELAELSIRGGDFTAALSNLDKAIKLDPDDLTAHNRRAVALLRLGRTAEAKAEQDAIKRLKDELAHVNNLREQLIKSPHDKALQLEAARWMFDHGHDAEGVRWAEKILGEDAGNAEASRLLVDHYQRQGNPGRANFYRLQGSTETNAAAVKH